MTTPHRRRKIAHVADRLCRSIWSPLQPCSSAIQIKEHTDVVTCQWQYVIFKGVAFISVYIYHQNMKANTFRPVAWLLSFPQSLSWWTGSMKKEKTARENLKTCFLTQSHKWIQSAFGVFPSPLDHLCVLADGGSFAGTTFPILNNELLALLSVPPPDDTVSASSNMDMEDRVSHLEQKLQLQEDEIQLLKSALADALRRLGSCEEQTQGMHPGAAGRRPLAAAAPAQPTKGNWSERCRRGSWWAIGFSAELNLFHSCHISKNHWNAVP